jgi:Protein of unknown function (DUF2934)
MKLRVAPGSRQKVRAGSSEHDARPGGSGLSETRPPEDVPGRIASLAYQLYEQRGREDGHEVEDWLEAEQRILAGKS